MKKILGIIIALCLISSAHAQETRAQAIKTLMGQGIAGAPATEIAGLGTGLGIFGSDLRFSASGTTVAIQEATSAATCMGSVTANATTPVDVTTSCATTNSRVFLTKTSTSAVNGSCYISTAPNNTKFTITCLATDTGTYNWVIFHEAP